MERHAARDEGIDVPALYRSHWLSMVRLAVLLVSDNLVAEDVAQEAFLALYRNQHRLRDPAAAIAYVRASVVNGSRSALRHRSVVRRRAPAPDLTPFPAADDRVLLAEEQREIFDAVQTLPSRQREVLVLRYWSGLSEAQIADALGVSAGTVKSTASRALAALRLALKETSQ